MSKYLARLANRVSEFLLRCAKVASRLGDHPLHIGFVLQHVAKHRAVEGVCWVWYIRVEPDGITNGPAWSIASVHWSSATFWLAHTLFGAPDPHKDLLAHTCHNSRCVNPAHIKIADGTTHESLP